MCDFPLSTHYHKRTVDIVGPSSWLQYVFVQLRNTLSSTNPLQASCILSTTWSSILHIPKCSQQTALNYRHFRFAIEDLRHFEILIILSTVMRTSALSSLKTAAALPLKDLSLRSVSPLSKLSLILFIFLFMEFKSSAAFQ